MLRSISIILISLGFALTSLLSFGAKSDPNYTTAKDFAYYCGDLTKESKSYGWCKGFITGYDQVHTTMSYILTKKSLRKKFDIKQHGYLYCPPDNISHLQAIKIIVKYINGHPKDKSLPAGLVASYALHDKFPCKK